jgi:hypothetical protein
MLFSNLSLSFDTHNLKSKKIYPFTLFMSYSTNQLTTNIFLISPIFKPDLLFSSHIDPHYSSCRSCGPEPSKQEPELHDFGLSGAVPQYGPGFMKGAGTLLHVLHVCYSFRQKCSKLGTHTTQGLKNNFYLRCFSISVSL